MKNKVDKRELKFEEYNSMTEEQFKLYEEANNQKLAEVEAKIAKIESYIDDIKDERVKNEKNQEKLVLENEKSQLLKEKKYIDGYTNNKDSILIVKEYEATIDAKIEKCKAEKEKYVNEIKELEEQKIELEKAEEIKKEEKNIEKAEKGINDWLENPEKLTNNELYVEAPEMQRKLEVRKEKLAEKKVELQKSIKAIDNKIKWRNTKIASLDKKIVALEQSKNKCKFVYRNLMNNKTWDEISYDATKKFNKKEVTKEVVIEQVQNEKTENIEEKVLENKEENVQVVENEVVIIPNSTPVRNQVLNNKEIYLEDEYEEEIIEEVEENTSIAEYDKFKEKHPKLAKIRDWFRKVGNAIFDFLDDDFDEKIDDKKLEEELIQEERAQIVKEALKEDVKEEIEEVVPVKVIKEEKSEIVKEEKEIIKVRDSFIDGLHVNVDTKLAKQKASQNKNQEEKTRE